MGKKGTNTNAVPIEVGMTPPRKIIEFHSVYVRIRCLWKGFVLGERLAGSRTILTVFFTLGGGALEYLAWLITVVARRRIVHNCNVIKRERQ
ncbi:MAG: hypothetical protein C7B43_04525 [Sulfobacillus benefaciens]|uniref:Uncharacterized protein n=1 Tax=Sulfobacillus benefaciens TaxID=453960 RepID=A0A2T2X8D1_9FIRM|nr:MAG: hypothetical protein C7B43_04525 [Sulfobacillus benefaciens]